MNEVTLTQLKLLYSSLVYMFKKLISTKANKIIKFIQGSKSLFDKNLKPTDIWYFYQKNSGNLLVKVSDGMDKL